MLDPSAALDTFDLNIFLENLVSGFGVGETALEWITSHLSQRTQPEQIKGILAAGTIITQEFVIIVAIISFNITTVIYLKAFIAKFLS